MKDKSKQNNMGHKNKIQLVYEWFLSRFHFFKKKSDNPGGSGLSTVKMSNNKSDVFVDPRQFGDISSLLGMDFEERCHYERERYRECQIHIDSVEGLREAKFKIEDDEGKTHTVYVKGNTVILDVHKPGDYQCIYKYKLEMGNPTIKGKMLCIADIDQYAYFVGIKDLDERIKHIASYSRCSREQKKHLIETSQREEATGNETDSKDRLTRRDVITDPAALEMMFNLCKHTFPEYIRSLCTELIDRAGRGRGSGSSMILADVLYTCGKSDPKKPFLPTKECLEIFRNKRYGDEPWVKDIIRQIRLLDRCDDSGAVFVLVGPPGTGKTAVAEAIAECMQKRFCVVNCRNKNGMEIGGCHKTYSDSCHGEIQENLLYYGNDCCMLLDEFEKMVITEKEGNPFALFVSTWDDRKTFTDAFTQVPVPTQNVVWILTVNTMDNVPDYIQNRFHENIFVLDAYSAEMKAEIAKRFIVPKYMQMYNFTNTEVQFTSEGLMAIARTTSDAGARITAQKIEKVLRAANELLEEGASMPIIIDAEFALSALRDTAKSFEDEQFRKIGY